MRIERYRSGSTGGGEKAKE
jgi:hypothetical protein